MMDLDKDIKREFEKAYSDKEYANLPMSFNQAMVEVRLKFSIPGSSWYLLLARKMALPALALGALIISVNLNLGRQSDQDFAVVATRSTGNWHGSKTSMPQAGSGKLNQYV